MKAKNLLKKAFLLLALVGGANSAWAADYTVTATRVLSNSDKTCTWSAITANNKTAFQSSTTALGDGLYFVAVGKITLDGGNSLNVKANGEMYIEVPSASSAGTVTINNGSATDRYFQTESTHNIYTKDNGTGINTVEFTSADIVDVSGVKYLKLTSKSDCKFGGVSITLSGEEKFPSLGEPEITAVSICGNAISASDLATLKSTHALSVAGSTVNGMPGTINVTVLHGATTVTRTISGTSAIYSFTVNAVDYTVTITDVNETYTALGCIVSHSGEDLRSFTTADRITFTMVADKTFQYGSGRVTISGTEYTPLKLSTGSAVEVTFPTGTVATKVKVYGWSVESNGKLASMGETSELTKSVTVNSDVFYATNTASDIYPTVYEYDLDNWESLYFNPTGSPSQPFVVMDFELKVPVEIGTTGYATFSSKSPVNVDITGLEAYVATGESGNYINMQQVTGNVAANTGLVLKGTPETTYYLPVKSSGTAYTQSSTPKNYLFVLDGSFDNVSIAGSGTNYVLSVQSGNVVWAPVTSVVAPAPAGHAALWIPVGGGLARAMRFNGITEVESIEAAPVATVKNGAYLENGKIAIYKNGMKFNANGARMK